MLRAPRIEGTSCSIVPVDHLHTRPSVSRPHDVESWTMTGAAVRAATGNEPPRTGDAVAIAEGGSGGCAGTTTALP
jgi:hypothetical protein